jgi:hypothetical protein
MRNLSKSFLVPIALIWLASGCVETQHYLRDTRKFFYENVKFTTEDPLDPSAPSYWVDYMGSQGGG